MKYKTVLPALSVLLLAGCQSSGFGDSSAHTPQSAGSQLSQLQSLRCASGPLAQNATFPASLYQEMVTCARQGQFDKAATFYGIAGTFSSYDALSVNTRYARERHVSLLNEGLAPLTASERERTWAAIRDTMETPRKKELLCQRVRHFGPPQYRPDYMLTNSISFQGTSADGSIGRWNTALRSYLDC